MTGTVKKKSGKASIIEASKDLQLKVGTGKVDEKTVAAAQKIVDNTKVDFAPIAKPQLDKLKAAIAEAHQENNYGDVDLEKFTTPIMNLKANAGTFKYQLVSDMANTVLLFLEGLKKPDKKVIQIVDLLHKTILLIIARQMTGDGGKEGKALKAAFTEVCSKYKPS